MQVSKEIEKNLLDVAMESYRRRHKKRLSSLRDFTSYFGVERDVLDADIVQKLKPLVDAFGLLFPDGPLCERVVDIRLSPSCNSPSVTRVSVWVKNPDGFFRTMYIKDLYPEQYTQYFKYINRADKIRSKMQDRLSSLPRDLNIAIKMTPTLKEFHKAFPLWYSMLKEIRTKSND